VTQDPTHTKWTNALAWTAATLFVAAWFLPVLADVPGWMAFRFALAPIVPYHDAPETPWDDAAPQAMSALTNVVFVILFVLWATRQTPRPGMFVRMTLACFLINLYWFVNAWRENAVKELLAGYYVWVAAFALLLAVAILIAVVSRRAARAGSSRESASAR
jgi:hypothetical protein